MTVNDETINYIEWTDPDEQGEREGDTEIFKRTFWTVSSSERGWNLQLTWALGGLGARGRYYFRTNHPTERAARSWALRFQARYRHLSDPHEAVLAWESDDRPDV